MSRTFLCRGIFAVKMTAECQTDRGDGFPERKICAKKLPHRRVWRRPAEVALAVAGASRIVALGTVS